jgi:hypothetical protein
MNLIGPIWSYEGAAHVVYEIEHLFGFDVVLCMKGEGGRWIPMRIITRAFPLGQYQRKYARAWMNGHEAGNYAQVTNAEQSLHEAEPAI